MADKPSLSFRWQSFFQRAAEPVFLLSRQRRILFVNQAWAQLTGLEPSQARGLVCSSRSCGETGPWPVLEALCPPPEVVEGNPGRVRRLVRQTEQVRSLWEIEFFPLRDEQGLLGILGKIAARPMAAGVSLGQLPKQILVLRDQLARRFGLDLLASQVPAMHRVREQVRLASQTRTPVLIVGEPGTGKHWLARIIHHNGLTRDGMFAAIDCAGLPPAALACALFGEGGRVVQSDGTLYLREPARLPRDLQARIVDFLSGAAAHSAGSSGEGSQNEAKTPPRVVAGCSTDPPEEVRAGRLLEHLHWALGTLIIALPPLRQRQADFPELVQRLLKQANASGGPEVMGLTPKAWDIIHSYGWPGNLRELAAVLVSARARARGNEVDAGDLPAYLRLAVTMEQTPGAAPQRLLPLDQLLEQAERRLIQLALRRAQGNKSRAAELLAIWRPRLHRRMEALGIADTEGRPPPSSSSPADIVDDLEVEEILDERTVGEA